MPHEIDLLSLVESGGCSAKLPAGKLKEIVSRIPVLESENLLVGTETGDDALVYKINETTALIQTTDFFPPVCSDPYDFGQVAAANALSDIFAMGGEAVTALNIVMFPSAKMEISILEQILKGGAEKVIEAGAVLAGGHTIDDAVPKYGLAVTGIIHPDKIITNCCAEPGDLIILTKALGTAVIIAGKKINETDDYTYNTAVSSMKQLNRNGSLLMQKYDVKCATDVTGFSLCGHLLEMAEGSDVSIEIDSSSLPLLPGVYDLLGMGCIPGASFRNLKHVEKKISFHKDLDYNIKMAALDAQTSGGLLICIKPESAISLLNDLKNAGYNSSSVIGKVNKKNENSLPLEMN
ncbi:MAG: selenide, water dikinase SelD [Spirochaetes bacterium]|nr:selenide, water dikinase SelD [Spirochaetota bacterium]